MRGERASSSNTIQRYNGSSPHARGTRCHVLLEAEGLRFIPACAGNAARWSSPAAAPAVHPRMRGERGQLLQQAAVDGGSSPHARGTLARPLDAAASRRFIPACAGNASAIFFRAPTVPVHPRMRGERRSNIGRVMNPPGSSPHARGTQAMKGFRILGLRFIPACAGNASPLPSPCRTCSVHPRMRGERTSNKLLIYRRKSEPSDSTKHSAC